MAQTISLKIDTNTCEHLAQTILPKIDTCTHTREHLAQAMISKIDIDTRELLAPTILPKIDTREHWAQNKFIIWLDTIAIQIEGCVAISSRYSIVNDNKYYQRKCYYTWSALSFLY